MHLGNSPLVWDFQQRSVPTTNVDGPRLFSALAARNPLLRSGVSRQVDMAALEGISGPPWR